MAFTLGGRVEEIRVATGDTVAAGEVLARLDRSPFQNSLSQAQANLARVESMLDQANRSLPRVAALGNAATREELEIRESAVLELEAGRREADVAVVEANRQIREATLTAPFDGEIVGRLADRGEVVAAGAPVFFLSGATTRMEVELLLPERLLGRIDPSEPVTVALPLSPDIAPRSARITNQSEHASGPGGLFPVTVSLDDEFAAVGVRPGFRAEVAVPVALPMQRVLIDPAALIARPDGSPLVFVVDTGRVREVPVDLHLAYADQIIVSGALSPGDLLVVSGQRELLDGESVEVALR